MRPGSPCGSPGRPPCGGARPGHGEGERAGGIAPLGAWLVQGGLLVLVLLGITLSRAWTVVHVDAGLHVDEAQYWAWSRALDWGYYSKPPAIAALIAASTAVLGDSLLGVKALAMLCYPLTAWVLYRLATEMAGEAGGGGSTGRAERAGWLAAGLFMVSPVAALLGLVATTDAPLLLAWALASRALWRAARGDRWRDWLWVGLWLGLGLLSKYTMAAFAVSVAGVGLTLARPRRLAGPMVAGAVAALLFAPHLMWNALHGWPTLRHTAEITLGAQAEPLGRTLAGYLGGLVLLLGPVVAPWGAWQALHAWRQGQGVGSGPARAPDTARRTGLVFAAWLAGPVLLAGLAQALHAQAELNWAAPALIGAILAITLVVAPQRTGGVERLSRWHAVLAVQAVVLSAVTLAGDLAHAVGEPLPRRLDVWARMRGWEPAFDGLRPALAEALAAHVRRHPHAPAPAVLGADRAVLAHGAWAWRGLLPPGPPVPTDGPGVAAPTGLMTAAWAGTTPLAATAPAPAPGWVAWQEAGRPPMNHFELSAPLRPARQPRLVWVVSAGELPAGLRAALARPPRVLAQSDAEQSPGRRVRLTLWEATLAPLPAAAAGPQEAAAG
ncbi:ArnT family glycosyltransferase [Ideonella sp.]|uniref:ArnT family glycosyltransferase n=1 Tax=Ideonella sp. TaxID=1929293 RepID=UPI0035B14D3B